MTHGGWDIPSIVKLLSGCDMFGKVCCGIEAQLVIELLPDYYLSVNPTTFARHATMAQDKKT
jgi:hypothetical protein